MDADGQEREPTAAELAEERLRLEREALAVERERLAAARRHAEEESRLVLTRRRPVLVFASVAMLAALCFVGGVLAGIAVMEARQQRLREARLAQALSKLNLSSGAAATNGVERAAVPQGRAHREVEVVVIQ